MMSSPETFSLRIFVATAAISIFLSGLTVAQESSQSSEADKEQREREQRVLDRAISCDESAESIADPATRYLRKIDCYKDYMAAFEADPAVLEAISDYEEQYAEALNAQTPQAGGHPFQGQYDAWRGYTSPSRPKPDTECLSEYGPFPVTVDEDGIVEFSIENRLLRGVVDKDGNMTVNGRTSGRVNNKKIGLIDGRKFKSRFTIDGPVSDASMVSGYCQSGYFRMTRK